MHKNLEPLGSNHYWWGGDKSTSFIMWQNNSDRSFSHSALPVLQLLPQQNIINKYSCHQPNPWSVNKTLKTLLQSSWQDYLCWEHKTKTKRLTKNSLNAKAKSLTYFIKKSPPHSSVFDCHLDRSIYKTVVPLNEKCIQYVRKTVILFKTFIK